MDKFRIAKKTLSKVFLLVTISLLVLGYFYYGLDKYLSFENLKEQQKQLQDMYNKTPAFSLSFYFIVYIAATALSLPGAVILTLAGGAIFGFLPALFVVSFASTLGATLAFLLSRYLFSGWVEKKWSSRLETVHRGVEKEGALYLFTLRLIPIFPFFVINLVFGLSRLKTWTFYWVSQVGMLGGTAVYVYAGTQIGQMDSPRDIMSMNLLLSFALIGLFPLVTKKALPFIQNRFRFNHSPREEKLS